MAPIKDVSIIHLSWLLVTLYSEATIATTITTTTTTNYTTTTSTMPWSEAFAANLSLWACLMSSVGAVVLLLTLLNILSCLQITRKLLPLRSNNEGVKQVDATVTKNEKILTSASDEDEDFSYLLDYTFTGTHPKKGAFRMTSTNNVIDEELHSSLELENSVPVRYQEVDPKNCALMHEIDEFYSFFETKRIECSVLGIASLCCYLIPPLVTFKTADYILLWFLFAIIGGGLVLCAIHACFLACSLCARRNGEENKQELVLRYGEEEVEHTKDTAVTVDTAPLLTTPPSITNQLESCEMAEFVTESDGATIAHATVDTAPVSAIPAITNQLESCEMAEFVTESDGATIAHVPVAAGVVIDQNHLQNIML